MFWIIFWAVLGLFNLFTFLLMAWDKQRARARKRRVPEAQFFSYALFGGSVGVLLAMPLLRHKNRKWSFKGRIYTIGVGQVLLFIVAWQWFGAYLF